MAKPRTIDPAEFSDAGVLARGQATDLPPLDPAELDDENLHPPGSPGWAMRQEMRRPAGDTLPPPLLEEDRARTAEQKARAKIAAANARFVEEAEAHKIEMAKAAAVKQTELQTLLGCMDEDEARRVRMEAYLRALDAGHGSQRERQLHADTLALRLALYMVEGRAE